MPEFNTADFRNLDFSDVLAKYFLDRNGIPTRRMANVPGKGHFDLAKEIVGSESEDLYQQMFKLGYARVLERENEIHVESPRTLTRKQREYLEDKANGRPIILNDRNFMESKDERSKKASKIVTTLIES
jgi:hypothetical protein